MPKGTLTVRISDEARAVIDKAAAEDRRSLAYIVELAVMQWDKTRKPAPSRTEDTINMA